MKKSSTAAAMCGWVLRGFVAAACVLQGNAPIANAGIPVFEPPMPLELHTNHGPPGYSNYSPVAATSGSGTWVVAWESTQPLYESAYNGDDDIHFARSVDHGLTFSERAALNTDAAYDSDHWGDLTVKTSDFAPSLAADGTGTFIAVWERSSLNGRLLELSRSTDDGVTWSPNAILASDAMNPQVATDGAGTWIIVWDKKPGDVSFTRSTDHGATWSPPALLETGTARIIYPHILFAGGVWLAAWSTETPPPAPFTRDVVVSRSINGGASWSAPAVINSRDVGEISSNQFMHFAGDAAGTWLIAWRRNGGDSPDLESNIFVARSTDGAATWSTPATLLSVIDFGMPCFPFLSAGPPGTFVALWQCQSSDPASPFGNDPDVWMSASIDGGTTWSPMQPLNDAMTDNRIYGFDISPSVFHDPAGHWFALWGSNDTRLASNTKGSDVDIVIALADFPCGNGVLDGGEQCDTGRRGDLDCCSRVCTLETAGTVCAADSELCTVERCDGAGTCNHLAAAAGTHCAADQDLCTFDRCDGASNCEHVAEPRDDCRKTLSSKASKLQIETDGTAEGGTLKWKWSRGELTVQRDIVDAIGEWDYALCLFDSTGLVTRIDAPNYADCFTNGGERDCWKWGRNLQYSVPEGIPNGMTKLLVASGTDGKAHINLRGEGANLDLPSLPITGFPLTVQLVNAKEACWEATYSQSPRTNDMTSFKASSD